MKGSRVLRCKAPALGRNLAVAGAVLALAITLAAPGPAAAQISVIPTCGPNDFVSAHQGGFQCDGTPFRFVGANHREMVHLWHALVGYAGFSGPDAAQVLSDQLGTAAEMGVTVMRVYLPREEKGPATFNNNQADYHRFLGDQLQMLLDFATLQNPPTIVNPLDQDYRGFRPGGPPAPNMKFLVSLTDSIYDPGKGGLTNAVLQDDLPAYTRTFNNLQFLDHGWFRPDRRGQALNYEDNYQPLVEYIVERFRDDERVFGWEIGNEMQAANTGEMRDFLRDMTRAIRRNDRNHLVTTGFISSCHASNIAANTSACNQQVVRSLHQGTHIDFGSVHMYNNEWSNPPCTGCGNYLGQDVDLGFFGNRTPYIVGELGFDGANNGASSYPGGTWQIGSSTITFESTATNPRTGNIHQTLNGLYDHLNADGVFPWAFFAGTNGANFSIDGGRGMDQVAHTDWNGLYDVYQCRAGSLSAANRGLNQIDLAIQRIEWENLTSPGTTVAVGDRVRLRIRVCNAGDLATNQGVGLSLFLDNDGANPMILAGIGNIFVPDNVSPGRILALDFEWTVVDPSTLDSRLSGPSTVLVGIVDDLNVYSNEITETNNGHAIDFPIQTACATLVNPSFENPAIQPPWDRVSSMPGWTGPVDIHREPDLPASDGLQVVDLNQNSFGHIQQTFATVPGREYLVSFYHGVNYHCQGSASFSVDIDGSSVDTFIGDDTPAPGSITFTAMGTSTVLRFRSLTGGCGASTIDDVRVTCP